MSVVYDRSLTYAGKRCSLALVAGLEPPQKWDTVSRLALQLPVAHYLGNELSLLVERDAVRYDIQSIDRQYSTLRYVHTH